MRPKEGSESLRKPASTKLLSRRHASTRPAVEQTTGHDRPPRPRLLDASTRQKDDIWTQAPSKNYGCWTQMPTTTTKKPHDVPRNSRKLYENPPGSPKKPQEVPGGPKNPSNQQEEAPANPARPQEAPRSPRKPQEGRPGRVGSGQVGSGRSLKNESTHKRARGNLAAIKLHVLPNECQQLAAVGLRVPQG